jgi:hypothetical protein
MVDLLKVVMSVFPDGRVSSGYVRVRCPYHKGGKEKRPSMSILLEQRGSMSAGTCHCFACGKVVTINELLEKVGANPIDTTAIQSQQVNKPVTLSTDTAMYKPQLPYRFSSYLAGRGIGERVQKLFKVYEKDKKVYMPIFNRQGKYMYVNARSTEGKRFYIEPGAEKTLWGIEEIDLSRPIVVCEAQIDAMSFWEVGMQAVATLGTGNIKALNEIKGATSIIILAYDNDESGRSATEKAAELLGRFRCKYVQFTEEEDINNVLVRLKDKEKVLEYITENTKNMKSLRTL